MDLAGRCVVVTGASGGIGAAFARRLSADGATVVAVARNEDRLRALAAEAVRSRAGARVEVVPLDLTDAAAAERLQQRVEDLGLEVDGLVNNAGMGTNGAFAGTRLERVLAQVDLDVRSVVELTHRFLPAMIERRRGWIVNIGSTSAYQPTPGMATYGASKAFIRSFSDAIWFEARPAGVRIVGVAPGPVDTGFFDAAGAQFLTKGRMAPDEIASFALARLDAGGPMAVPGLRNRLGTLGERFAPRRALIAVAARIVAPAGGSRPRMSGAAAVR